LFLERQPSLKAFFLPNGKSSKSQVVKQQSSDRCSEIAEDPDYFYLSDASSDLDDDTCSESSLLDFDPFPTRADSSMDSNSISEDDLDTG
jgi:hypothetical protein